MIIRTFKISLVALLALSIPSAFAQKKPPVKAHVAAASSAAPNPAELIYVPLPTCRAFYTASSSGNINANASRDFYIAGTGSQFTTQGGTSNGCGVPTNATAAAISFTAFNTTGYGGLLAYAQGTTKPALGRILSFQAGQTVTGTAIIPLANNEITLTALSAATQAAGDVTGYYIPQIEAYINASGSIGTSTSRILSVNHTASGSYVIAIDRYVDSCNAQITPVSPGTYASGATDGSNVDVTTWILSSTAGVSLRDETFNISVHC